MYVAPYPYKGSRAIRVSSSGGALPRWGRGGELFYLSSNQLMGVTVRTAAGLDVGNPVSLFRLTTGWLDYDVAPDGKRFLAVVSDVIGREQPVTVVMNWPSEIRR